MTPYTKVGQSSMNPVHDFKSKIWSNSDVFQRSISSLNFGLVSEINKLVHVYLSSAASEYLNSGKEDVEILNVNGRKLFSNVSLIVFWFRSNRFILRIGGFLNIQNLSNEYVGQPSGQDQRMAKISEWPWPNKVD